MMNRRMKRAGKMVKKTMGNERKVSCGAEVCREVDMNGMELVV